MKKRILALVLTLAMLCTLAPQAALAADGRDRLRLEADGVRSLRGADPAAEQRESCVWYESDLGSLFYTTDGSDPEAVPEAYLLPRTQLPLTEDMTALKLLLDRSRGFDWDYYGSTGEYAFFDREPEGLDELYVLVRRYDGESWTSTLAVERGAVAEGCSLEDQILSVPLGGDVYTDVYVYWSEASYIFGTFAGTEACPIVVELCVWGRGVLELPDFVLPENSFRYNERLILRVAEDVETLTLVWPSGCRVNYIGGYLGMGWDWYDAELPEDNAFSLDLTLLSEEGERKTYYYTEFSFDDWYRGMNGEFRVDALDRSMGSAFFSLGEETPVKNADSYCWEGESRSFLDQAGEPMQINLLLDQEQVLNEDAYWNDGVFELTASGLDEAERSVWVVAACAQPDGSWAEEPVVADGRAVKEGFSCEDNVLSFTPVSSEELWLNVFFAEANYRVWYFPGTEERPVLVQYTTNDPEALSLPEGIPGEDTVTANGGTWGKLRVSADTETLTFSWPESCRVERIAVEEYGNEGSWIEMEADGSSFTLVLDEPGEDGSFRDWYNLSIDFVTYDWVGKDSLLCVWYDRWPGSLFWGLGDETPAADPDRYVNEGWEEAVSFASEGEARTIRLLLDNTQGINWDVWNEEGRVELEERDPEWDSDGFYAIARYVDENGEWYDGPVLVDGETVREGWSFEDRVLCYTPTNAYNIELSVWWRFADYAFDGFGDSDECPVVVTVWWNGDGSVSVPEGVGEEDCFVQPEQNRLRVRVPFETESLTFTWEGELERISGEGLSEGGGWAEITPEGDSFTLDLDKTDEWGNPRTWYDLNFSFVQIIDLNWGRTFTVENGGWGAVYQAVGDTGPEKSAESLTTGEERSFAGEDGECLPIRLLLDPEHRAWIGEDGSLAEEEPLCLRDREIFVHAGYFTDEGEGRYEPLVLGGEAVQDFVSYDDGLLVLETEGLHELHLSVKWSQAELDVDQFPTTEEKPILVWWTSYARSDAQLDAVYAPEGIPAEDMVFSNGFGAARVSADTESLCFRWAPGCGPGGISSRSDGDPDWAEFVPEGESFTLLLDQTEEDGSPKTFYHVLFFFDEPAPVNPFTDVAEGKYYYDAVLWAFYHDPQITGGTGDGTTFSPKATCKREQIVTFLWNACGAPEPETTENPFTDVKASKYYYKAVLWAVENGITTGTTPTTFGVGKDCTRAQVMTFLWSAAGSPEPETAENPFADVKASAYYYKAVLWAVENGVTTGTSATTFSPKATCTRGQIVTFLYNALRD